MRTPRADYLSYLGSQRLLPSINIFKTDAGH